MKIFGVVGWKNNGKTGLMERLVAELTVRGLRVSTIKHAHHRFDVDHKGKDSYRHRAAGAHEVLLASRRRFTLMHEVRGEREPPLAMLLMRMDPVDLVLVEGYKRDDHAKIEVHRSATGQPLIAVGDPTVVAVASDVVPDNIDCPVFALDDTVGITEFVLKQTGLEG